MKAPPSLQHLFQRFWEIAGGVSVRSKILGIVLGLVILLGLGITVQVRQALTRTMAAQLAEQSVSVARDLAARSTDLILLNDLFALHRLLEETKANNQNVVYAFLLDTNSQVLASTYGEAFPVDLIAVNPIEPTAHHHTIVLATNQGYVWDTAVPILEGQVGTARVGLSDASLRRMLVTITNQLLLTTALVSLIGITAATFLTWILTRPILDLAQAAQAVAQGNFTKRVKRWANDEIGELATAFNQMVGELAKAEEIRREREFLRRQLLEKVIVTQEDERKRIARELHDSTSQTLTSLIMGLKVMEGGCADTQTQLQARELRQIAVQTLEEVHDLAMQLRPRLLDDLGLRAALERLVKEWQTRYHIAIDLMYHVSQERLPDVVETALYRIIQEALTNVARHAQAHNVSVLIEQRGEELVAVIEDDGIGFDISKIGLGDTAQAHLGLAGMQERAALLGGTITFESEIGHGTSIYIQLPIPKAMQNELEDYGVTR
ncbi:MAG: HAMP domain-containing protein [Anaerolineales bacterium]